MLTLKSKIVIIGSGNVGEAIGYTLMVRKQASEIVFVDLNEERAQGSALDIAHGTSFFHQTNIRKGGYEECADAQIIIVTAGMARKPGQTRLDLAKTNVSIARNITRSIMQYAKDPLIIVVSNPVDILTYVIQQESGLPAHRVIGTGTTLDTARFRYLLSQACKVNVSDINAYVLGEHGDSQVAIWSRATVGGEQVQDYIARNKELGEVDYEKIAKDAKDAGAEVISLKGATFYGIAMSTSRIVAAIQNDEKAVLPVGHALLTDDHGSWKGIAFSLPCVIDQNGINKVLFLKFTPEEKAAMDKSAATLRNFLNDVLAQ